MSNNAIIAVILAKDEGNKKYSIMLGQVINNVLTTLGGGETNTIHDHEQ